MNEQPKISVGIIDRQDEVAGALRGNFHGDGFSPVSGRFCAKAISGLIVLRDEALREITCLPSIKLTAGSDSTFELFQVTIETRFHWERKEDQTFRGNLILLPREDGTIAAVNEISLEDYLRSVISSEMSADAPPEFLKVHAILPRSWLLSALARKQQKMAGTSPPAGQTPEKNREVIRWYGGLGTLFTFAGFLYAKCADMEGVPPFPIMTAL